MDRHVGTASPLVSVVIVNWNTRDLLRGCLASLPWDSDRVSLDVIVVDNGSDDGSAQMVEAQFPQVRLIRNEENLGFVRANNQGLCAAEADFMLMLNSDTEVRPGAIERLVEVLASDPRIGAAGSRLLNPDGSPQFFGGSFPTVGYLLVPAIIQHRRDIETARRVLANDDPIQEVDWLSGAAVMTRRDVLEAVGPLDERYFMWFDDHDWGRKLQRAGYRRVMVADARVIHLNRRSAEKLGERTLSQQLYDSEYLYLRLHAGRAATTLIFLSRIARAAARWLLSRGETRGEAAWRLRYHRTHFIRACFAPVPPPPPPFPRRRPQEDDR